MTAFRGEIVIALGLVGLTLAAYAAVGLNDFIDLDDTAYVTDNPEVQRGLSGESVRWAWTTLHAGYWQPRCRGSLEASPLARPGTRSQET